MLALVWHRFDGFLLFFAGISSMGPAERETDANSLIHWIPAPLPMSASITRWEDACMETDAGIAIFFAYIITVLSGFECEMTRVTNKFRSNHSN